MLSDEQLRALMLAVHAAIDDAAQQLAAGLARGDADVTLLPPGGSLSASERDQVASLAPHAAAAESALRTLIADACASAFFDVFNVLDATGDPDHYDGAWLPIELTMGTGAEQSLLHDELTESWWEWERLRPGP